MVLCGCHPIKLHLGPHALGLRRPIAVLKTQPFRLFIAIGILSVASVLWVNTLVPLSEFFRVLFGDFGLPRAVPCSVMKDPLLTAGVQILLLPLEQRILQQRGLDVNVQGGRGI